MSEPTGRNRCEQDALGTCMVPADALYGVHSVRALDNFPSSGRRLGDEARLLAAFAQVKRAAAVANAESGVLDGERASAIGLAADEVVDGRHREQFIVDLLEGAGGTSLNMNVNEVLANRALQLLGREPGDYAYLHPNDHVNRSQSTNDVVPTAILMASHSGLGVLLTELEALQQVLAEKARQFASIMKLGRTCLQDAQPMTLGQSFEAYAALVARSVESLRERQRACLHVPLGATAIGTGFGAPAGYRECAIRALGEATGIAWQSPASLFDGLANADGYSRLAGELRAAAGGLAKMANDLMLLSSGPHGGLAELRLPALQAGSSIMPGKVNPVVPLSVCQAAFAVTGCDAAIAAACQQGQLEINPYEPLIAAQLMLAMRLLRNAVWQLRTRCLDRIEPNVERMRSHLHSSSASATALVPRFGYETVSAFVKRAETEGVTFLELVVREGIVGAAEMDQLLLAAVR
jgi:aspartate ammonia-lyase